MEQITAGRSTLISNALYKAFLDICSALEKKIRNVLKIRLLITYAGGLAKFKPACEGKFHYRAPSIY